MSIKQWGCEWSRQSEFNSFNSWKGLFYSKWYEAIKEGEFLPPVEASLDPINDCELVCDHCNARRYILGNNSGVNRMPDEHLLKLVHFLGKWGVKAVCFGGGGEPTLHSKLADALIISGESGLESSVSTNGTLLNKILIKNIVINCRWIGISVDAATEKTYLHGKKDDHFSRVTENIGKLSAEKSRQGSRCDITFKFLIFSFNQHEIYDACRIAKDLGASSFHARPADFNHQGMGKKRKDFSGYDIELIKDQIARCRELETEDFRVYTIFHKFDRVMKPIKDFSQCFAAPLCIQLCANGKIYFCPDQRFVKEYDLGSHYPDPENILRAWGGEKHKRLVFLDGKKSCSSRCTFGPYNRQCEHLFINNTDPMFKFFV